MISRTGISCATGGSGDDLLLLLHGLGATGAVWERLLPLVHGRWVAPDLRGHGRSLAAPPYGYAVHAADMAELVTELGAGRVTVLAHSFGGVVGALLGSGEFGVDVDRVVAVGTKLEWTGEEESGARALADRPGKVFATRDEAAARHLALAGLRGLASPGDEVALAGVREVEGGWTVALDNRVFSAVGPSVTGILRRCLAPLHLAAGDGDAMVSLPAMQRIDPTARLIPGAGHNAHWESPAAVWSLMG
ncbi:alpha/beta fold hydrolase [Petropleomorpha daqingensis]|uniref:Pimeloyl-ACP methyl ester carboxylesterase n=1 Tax=Petropleomorpha daqingensis TaxID=2026353 RepID=A0A853CHR7_9ACTN|nr:pimeloyl-ACP methyl ester carboxylesterase [Petropleomorpha daqingensis]